MATPKGVTLEVEGLKELDAALAELGDARAVRNVSRRALREAAKPMMAAAARNAPYDNTEDDTFHISQNIKLQAERKKVRIMPLQFRLGVARVTATPADRTSYAIAGGMSASKLAPNYAFLIERQTAFLQRAFDAHYQGLLASFAGILRKHVDKEAAKIAKKAARANKK